MSYRLSSRRSPLSTLTGLVLFGALSLAASGCGSSNNNSGTTSTSCATKPSDCKPGTTCWVGSDGKYACLPAKAGAGKGTACTNVIGQPTCDEKLGCFPGSSGSAQGTCMPFCDNGGCGTDELCYQVRSTSGGPAVPMCGPQSSDAGSDSGPGPDAASDAGQQDSGGDSATEAGQTDAGSDAANEAGQSDSGSDAAQSDAAGD